jgi:protein phosphatase
VEPKVDVRSGGASQAGKLRDENQDAIRLSGEGPEGHGYLCALADGIGGYAHGGLASRTAVEALWAGFFAGRPQHGVHNLRRGFQAANLAVQQAAQRLGVARMGTTLTALRILGAELAVAHVGDSRAYLIRDGRARCLTRDHSVVGDLVRMKVLSPAQVRTHARRSILSRSLGTGPFVQPDVTRVRLRPGDSLLLCSDGVWAVLEDEELAGVAAQAPDPDGLTRRLIDLAVARESDDDVSAIAVQVHRLGADTVSRAARSWPWAGLARRRPPSPSEPS